MLHVSQKVLSLLMFEVVPVAFHLLSIGEGEVLVVFLLAERLLGLDLLDVVVLLLPIVLHEVLFNQALHSLLLIFVTFKLGLDEAQEIPVFP